MDVLIAAFFCFLNADTENSLSVNADTRNCDFGGGIHEWQIVYEWENGKFREWEHLFWVAIQPHWLVSSQFNEDVSTSGVTWHRMKWTGKSEKDQERSASMYCPTTWLESQRRQYEKSTLKMEAIRSSETFVTTYETTQHNNPEDHNRHFNRCENFKLHRVQILHRIRVTLWDFELEIM
jgi:hypothetical protein